MYLSKHESAAVLHSPQRHAQAVAALASEQRRAGWARESAGRGSNRSGGVRRLLHSRAHGTGAEGSWGVAVEGGSGVSEREERASDRGRGNF